MKYLLVGKTLIRHERSKGQVNTDYFRVFALAGPPAWTCW